MASRLFQQFQGSLEKGVVKLYATVVSSTSGTIASQSAKGLVVAKTAAKTGRYTITLADRYISLLNVTVTLQGAADAAYTTARGIEPFIRTVSMTDRQIIVQFVSTAGADAEIEDAARFYVEITLKNSSV